jgi:hypothetical protein
MGRVILSPYLGGIGVIAAVVLGAWADARGAWWVFAFSALQVTLSLFVENRRLKEALKPKLRLVFNADQGAPFVREKSLFHDGTNQPAGTLQIFSVGVANEGGTAPDVTVRITKVEPAELQAYWNSALHIANEPVSTSTRDIHPSPEPLAFFEVVAHHFDGSSPSAGLRARFATDALFDRPFTGQNRYFITLAIDGIGAERPTRYVVMRDEEGRYRMNVAAMQH